MKDQFLLKMQANSNIGVAPVSQEDTEFPDPSSPMERPLLLCGNGTYTSKRTESSSQTKLQLQMFSKTSVTETGATMKT